MFGYVTTNMEEMKIKDYRIYHGFYCGVCQDLKEDHGQTSRVTLTYDVTFLGILLTGLYETETKREEHFCAMHPFKKHLCLRNQWTAYAADMNVLLSYYNLLDDWEDEKKHVSRKQVRILTGQQQIRERCLVKSMSGKKMSGQIQCERSVVPWEDSSTGWMPMRILKKTEKKETITHGSRSHRKKTLMAGPDRF